MSAGRSSSFGIPASGSRYAKAKPIR
jgi:hypothetical protein